MLREGRLLVSCKLLHGVFAVSLGCHAAPASAWLRTVAGLALVHEHVCNVAHEAQKPTTHNKNDYEIVLLYNMLHVLMQN